MRLIVLALLLALALATAQAKPLQGSDANATAVLFGASRMPLEDENSTAEFLKIDVGLLETENATYQLMDADGNVYENPIYRPLFSGKQLVYFLVPKDSLFKLINVTPEGGKPIYINWWATPKKSNENLLLWYYGITDWLINSDEQGIVVQVRVQNNGTKNLYVCPENFTLLDQWLWPYLPTAGFDPETIEPQKARSDRVLLGFTGVSLISRPVALAYDYGTSNQIIIDFDKDYVPLSDEVVYGANATKSAATVQSAPVAALPTENQTEPTQVVQAPVKQNASSKISSIKEKVAASQARLAATRGDLDKKTPENSSSISA